MSKKFFEVFPTLQLDSAERELFEQVTVERVTSTKRKDFLRIYIMSEHLIQKMLVLKVEQEIKKQFFPNASMVIKIYEHFRLSAQYNPAKLMDAYRESILLELREYSPVEYNLFKKADIEFEENNKMLLTVEDSVLGRSKTEELIRILEKIFQERCGFPLEARIAYKEREEGRFRKEDEQKLAMQVAQIAARAGYATPVKAANAFGWQQDGSNSPEQGAGADGFSQEAADRYAQDQAQQLAAQEAAMQEAAAGAAMQESQTGAKGKWNKKGDRQDFRRALKRSDNPDVLLGKDFEGDAMPIEEIVGEVGEVVIRGKVLNFDKREIKNEKTILIFDVTDYSDTMTIKLFVHNDQVAEVTEKLERLT